MTGLIPTLLLAAVLLPLGSFFLILLAGHRLREHAAVVATGAILIASLLSFASFFIWVGGHRDTIFPDNDGQVTVPADPDSVASSVSYDESTSDAGDDHDHGHEGSGHDHDGDDHGDHGSGHDGQADTNHDTAGHQTTRIEAESGEYYTLGVFGRLQLTIGYYIDTLTICMFCMVTLIATLIHFYAQGYMHEEEDDEVVDHEVTLEDGSPFKRPGRYHRFFQYLSLFCFSMLGLVLAGNVAMVFVFWELVGICSYFLIGFYIERKSASTAANKAFIVNRVGDFGMIIGLMVFWTGCGTLSFGDYHNQDGTTAAGLFSQARPADNHHQLVTPEGLVKLSARSEIRAAVQQRRKELLQVGLDLEAPEREALIAAKVSQLRNDDPNDTTRPRYGYWLLIVGGLGIFCGCVGKSAQFPLHVWLPDAMEGPTPVSALVHSATMVAAGVYLVARFFPMFAPEVLLVIAVLGVITLFIAATIAITATDIKRVLAYSTISQLGYMMMALGVGAWAAGVFHLITHAFFKSLLFMCSGSVIHAVHTNEMTEMGGLRRKMPFTAYTMLIGCLAIAGAGIPFVIGLSGYYSKDAILEQAFSFWQVNNSAFAGLFFWLAAGGAALTSFYMFRLWFMTFAGQPRDEQRFEHAHESPRMMYVPLLILAFFAITIGWKLPDFMATGNFHLTGLLETARPAGLHGDSQGLVTALTWPDEHKSHAWAIKFPVTLLAFATAVLGALLAGIFYLARWLDPEEVRESLPSAHRFLIRKWYFDELYDLVFVRPAHLIGRVIYRIDRVVLDTILHMSARVTRTIAVFWDRVADQKVVDGVVNWTAAMTHRLGIALRAVQTGRLRQYVMFIVVAAVALFLVISFFFQSPASAGG